MYRLLSFVESVKLAGTRATWQGWNPFPPPFTWCNTEVRKVALPEVATWPKNLGDVATTTKDTAKHRTHCASDGMVIHHLKMRKSDLHRNGSPPASGATLAVREFTACHCVT